jgi:hypothetical protein
VSSCFTSNRVSLCPLKTETEGKSFFIWQLREDLGLFSNKKRFWLPSGWEMEQLEGI